MTDFRKTEFLRSAASEKDFYEDALPQIAFAGRSNVGKSSVINCLTCRKNFARVGATPGKTVHVNYFKTEGRFYLADLPGYGYARVAKSERDRWAALMESYFSRPERIRLGILVVDVRHAPTEDDKRMYSWFVQTGRPVLVLANKADKLRRTEIDSCLNAIREGLGMQEMPVLFSAEKGTGREVLAGAIETAVSL